MTIVRWDPVRDFLHVQNEVGRLLERTFGDEAGERAGRAWTPALDVYEKEGKIIVKADLPGVKAQDVDVTFENDRLTIEGTREFKEELEEDHVYRLERRYGAFRRSLPLAADKIKSQEIRASYSDGVLEVEVPKADEIAPTEIKIDVKAVK